MLMVHLLGMLFLVAMVALMTRGRKRSHDLTGDGCGSFLTQRNRLARLLEKRP